MVLSTGKREVVAVDQPGLRLTKPYGVAVYEGNSCFLFLYSSATIRPTDLILNAKFCESRFIKSLRCNIK